MTTYGTMFDNELKKISVVGLIKKETSISLYKGYLVWCKQYQKIDIAQ